MKTCFFVLVLLGSLAFAASWQEVESSAERLVQVLELELAIDSSTSEYIPGYGLHMTFQGCPAKETRDQTKFDPFELVEPAMTKADIAKTRADIESVLTDLSVLVKGLDKSEWISVRHSCDNTSLFVRTKQDTPGTFESWVDGNRVK